MDAKEKPQALKHHQHRAYHEGTLDRMTKKLLCLGKREISNIVAIITGHLCLRPYLHKLGKVESAECKHALRMMRHKNTAIANFQPPDG